MCGEKLFDINDKHIGTAEFHPWVVIGELAGLRSSLLLPCRTPASVAASN